MPSYFKGAARRFIDVTIVASLRWIRVLSNGLFGRVFFDFEVFDDELLALGSVLAHVKGEQVFCGHTFWYNDGVEAYVLADEVLELIGGDFAESFEAGDLRLGLTLFDRGAALIIAVAVAGDLLIAHSEERRLQDV